MRKRLTSLLMALAVSASLIPAGAMAEDTITLKYFNATASAIMLDFDGVAADAELTGYTDKITVTKVADGIKTENVPFTAAVTGNTVVLEPAAGEDWLDAIYKVDLAAGITDGTNTLAATNTGWFEVEQMFFDDFETGITSANKDTAQPNAPYYWTGAGLGEGALASPNWTSSKTWTVNDATIGDGSKSAIQTYDKLMYDKTAFNNGAGIFAVNTTGLPGTWPTYYTIEADLEFGDKHDASGAGDRIQMMMRNGQGITTEAGLFMRLAKLNADGTNVKIEVQDKADTTNRKITIASYTVASGPIKARMSAVKANNWASNQKWTHLQVYLNNDKVVDDELKWSERAGSFIGWSSSGQGSTRTSTFDNVSITKVNKDLPEPEIQEPGVETTVTATGDFNATLTAAMLELNQEAKPGADYEAKLKSMLTITKKTDGIEAAVTDFTAELSNGTIVIKPAEGFLTDTLYKIDLAADKFGSITVSEAASTDWFRVVELFADDFESGMTAADREDYPDPGYPYSWEQLYKSDGTANATKVLKSAYWTASYREGFVSIGDGKGGSNPDVINNYNKFMLRNNGVYAYLNEVGLPEDERVADYTIEAKLGMSNDTYSVDDVGVERNLAKLYIRNSESGTKSDECDGYGIELKNTDYAENIVALSFMKGNERSEEIASYRMDGYEVDLRLSAIGNNIEAYIDDDKVYDVTDEEAPINQPGSMAVLAGTLWNIGRHVTFDDVSITRVEKVSDWGEGEDSTADGGMVLLNAEAVVADNETDITATANILCNKDMGSYTVIAAAYNEGKLVNVATRTITRAEYLLGIAKGIEITIEGAAGADETNIMVWNSLSGMKPYVGKKI